MKRRRWVEYYNKNYLDSALGYKAPSQKEAEFYSKYTSKKTAA